MKHRGRLFLTGLILSLTFLAIGLALASQPKGQSEDQSEQKQETKEKKPPLIHEEITVTATRIEAKVFDTPGPVSVANKQSIDEKAPNNVSELLPQMPGLDMVGVGPNQSRPVIRGFRGQRILLLSDGIRMSNSRRAQDYGEIPSLVDISSIERIEVVRGPSSVLYGSDAIGGVINIISRRPDYSQKGTHISGDAGYRFSSADSQHKGFVDLAGNISGLAFVLNGSYRNAQDYRAPAGRFGKITLSQETPVKDSGVEDYSFNLLLGYRLNRNDFSLKIEKYDARHAGFGFVDPAAYAPGEPTIQLLYPKQDLQRLTLSYENRTLNFLLADGIIWTGYRVRNDRLFDSHTAIDFSPGAGIRIQSKNFTGVMTLGTRLELTKVLLTQHILTYGMDFYQDSAENTDSSSTTMFGFGPPQTTTSRVPNIPNADFRSLGLFVQDQWSFFRRTSLVMGLRYQSNYARTKATPGLTDPLANSTDKTLVGSMNLIYGLADNLNVVLSAGRGFRSPNLTERFFEGATPDGSSFQIRTPNLKAETSFNLEAGFRYTLGGFYLESSYFRNRVYGGITVVPTGEKRGRLPVHKNVNIDRLMVQGIEFLGQLDPGFGLSVGANFTYLKSKNLTNPELPFTEIYSSRLNLNLRYTVPGDLLWVEYAVRYDGDQKDVDLGINPIGSIIPGFTEHTLRAGTTIFKKSRFPQQVGILVGNLTNALYSEASNASFFRPAPKRHIVLTWSVRF